MSEKLPKPSISPDDFDKLQAEAFIMGGIDGLGEVIDTEVVYDGMEEHFGVTSIEAVIQMPERDPEDPLDLTTPHRFNKARATALGIGVVATVSLMAYGTVRRRNQAK